MITFAKLSYLDIFLLIVGLWTIHKLVQTVRGHVKTTKLNGPRSSNLLFGATKELVKGDSGVLYEQWAKEFGPVYQVPTPLGGRRTILSDPKAVAHFYSKETWTYVKSSLSKHLIETFVGKGVLWAEGESHRRQRRTLSPAFSNAAIRSLLPVFYDSAYKVKTAWDAPILGSNTDEAIIDVQKWMNRVALDSIGIAGFGHDFGALQGQHSTVEEVFDSFGDSAFGGLMVLTLLLGSVIPFLQKIPNARLMKKLHNTIEEVSEKVLERSRKEKEIGGAASDTSRSIIGSLLKAEHANSEMKTLILAGYETTSKKQDRLRAELAEFTARDPSYEQLTNGLPYLEAVTREIIRIHAPVAQTSRVASCDGVIPLSKPVTTASGELVDHISIARGSAVHVPIRAINLSEEIWGPDAKEFKPERWLNNEAGLTNKAREVQGYHHILSFIDGPRTCLGRAFAIAEFKMKQFLEFLKYTHADNGVHIKTKINIVHVIVPRPKVAGEQGYDMPMRVRRRDY